MKEWNAHIRNSSGYGFRFLLQESWLYTRIHDHSDPGSQEVTVPQWWISAQARCWSCHKQPVSFCPRKDMVPTNWMTVNGEAWTFHLGSNNSTVQRMQFSHLIATCTSFVPPWKDIQGLVWQKGHKTLDPVQELNRTTHTMVWNVAQITGHLHCQRCCFLAFARRLGPWPQVYPLLVVHMQSMTRKKPAICRNLWRSATARRETLYTKKTKLGEEHRHARKFWLNESALGANGNSSPPFCYSKLFPTQHIAAPLRRFSLNPGRIDLHITLTLCILFGESETLFCFRIVPCRWLEPESSFWLPYQSLTETHYAHNLFVHVSNNYGNR